MATTTILRLPEVQRLTGKSRSSIYSGIKNGTFPTQVRIGPRAVGWVLTEIEAHNVECINASRPTTNGDESYEGTGDG